MERKELISSDEYIKATIECIVVSGKSVKEMRKELGESFISLKNELHVVEYGKEAELFDKVDMLSAFYFGQRNKTFDMQEFNSWLNDLIKDKNNI